MTRLLFRRAIGEHFLHLAPRLGRNEQRALAGGASVALPGLQPALHLSGVERHWLAADRELKIETQPVLARAAAQ